MFYTMLCVYHFAYFIVTGISTFIPKYFGEIGMSNAQIGVLTSVPTIVAMIVMPTLGLWADRVPKKRYLLSAMLITEALICFIVPYSTSFLTLLAVISVFTIISTSIHPLQTTIALEYADSVGKSYGFIRLLGTAGYQAGALLVGIILSGSLKNLYPMMGVFTLIACVFTFALPNVEGHQHSKAEKVPLSRLFTDKHVKMLYIVIFFCTITTQFYMSFYTKHLGDLGMSNTTTSIITLLAVMAELPFLYFGDRLYKLTSMWNWLLIGMLANGVRWIGLAFSQNAVLNILFQIPAVSVLACFEFFPALYLNKRVPAELIGSAQNTLSLVTFGAAKIIGSLLGGQICEFTGIPAVFAFNGVMMLAGFALFWKLTRRMIREEKAENA